MLYESFDSNRHSGFARCIARMVTYMNIDASKPFRSTGAFIQLTKVSSDGPSLTADFRCEFAKHGATIHLSDIPMQ